MLWFSDISGAVSYLFDNLSRFEIEDFTNRAFQLFVIHFASAKCVDADTNGFWMTNSVGELHFAAVS